MGKNIWLTLTHRWQDWELGLWERGADLSVGTHVWTRLARGESVSRLCLCSLSPS